MTLSVLVTGASGFIGSHLARALVDEGHDVRAMTRRPDDYSGAGSPVAGDVFADDGLAEALAGVDVAYYLVHSLDSDDFEAQDAKAARAFSRAAADAGVRQIIYLGGLGVESGDGADLSPHLRSRREVEKLLASDGVPVTALRAAVVVGHLGVSWEITRQLIKAMPLMVAPGWVSTRTQPIGLSDVIRYLVGVLDHPDALGRSFDVGGPDVLTYEQMLRRASEVQHGRDVPVVAMPAVKGLGSTGLAADFASFGLSLITDVDAATARNLIASMETEVVVTETSIREVVPFEPMGYDDMVRAALSARLAEGLTL
ncbi:NAD(P)H-binding protein [Nocardioides sp.]|uniref:NAD(P)H-binding protein n=1 Tax=Nocardioides sp. TaxID=35761 RepID=UPI0035653BFE